MDRFFLFAAFAMALFVLPAGCTQNSAHPENSEPSTGEQESKEGHKVAVIETNMGTMVAELYMQDAPKSCENFINLANKDYYNGKQFYRVVRGHVIQAGGEGKDTVDYTIKAEINPHKHITGALGMARGKELDSATTEFYICHAPRPHLDGKYTIFGQLIEGLDVLEKIGNTEVEQLFVGTVAFHRPVKPVVIEKVTIKTIKK